MEGLGSRAPSGVKSLLIEFKSSNINNIKMISSKQDDLIDRIYRGYLEFIKKQRVLPGTQHESLKVSPIGIFPSNVFVSVIFSNNTHETFSNLKRKNTHPPNHPMSSFVSPIPIGSVGPVNSGGINIQGWGKMNNYVRLLHSSYFSYCRRQIDSLSVAEVSVRKAMAIFPEKYEAYELMGIIAWGKRDFKVATESYDLALHKLKKQNPQIGVSPFGFIKKEEIVGRILMMKSLVLTEMFQLESLMGVNRSDLIEEGLKIRTTLITEILPNYPHPNSSNTKKLVLDTYNTRSHLYFILGKLDLAVLDLDKAIDLSKNVYGPEYLFRNEIQSFVMNRALIRASMSNFEASLRDINLIIQIISDQIDESKAYRENVMILRDAILRRGEIFFQIGRIQLGINDLFRILRDEDIKLDKFDSKENPFSSVFTGFRDPIIDQKERLADGHSVQDEEVLCKIGHLFTCVGEFREAEIAYKRAIEKNPNEIRVYLDRLHGLSSVDPERSLDDYFTVSEWIKNNNYSSNQQNFQMDQLQQLLQSPERQQFFEKNIIHRVYESLNNTYEKRVKNAWFRFLKDRRRDVEIEKKQILSLQKLLSERSLDKDCIFYRRLGKGAFGITYLVRFVDIPGIYVAKVMHDSCEDEDKKMKMWKKDAIQIPYHRNIVMILAARDFEKIETKRFPGHKEDYEDDDEYISTPIVLMRYYRNTLTKYLTLRVKDRAPFSSLEIALILEGLLQGVLHLYENKIVHRDLHIDNVFVDEVYGRVFIGDFGCCLEMKNDSFRVKLKELRFDSISSNRGGCKSFLAPEIRFASAEQLVDYSKNDLFSVGVIGYYLVRAFMGVSKNTPESTLNEIIKKVDYTELSPFGINNRELAPLNEWKGIYDDELCELIQKIVAINPSERIDHLEAVKDVSTIVKRLEVEEEDSKEEVEKKFDFQTASRRNDDLIDRLSESIQKDPEGSQDLLLQRGQLYMRVGDFDLAMKDFEQGLDNINQTVGCRICRAYCCFEQKMFEDAIVDFTTVLSIEKKDWVKFEMNTHTYLQALYYRGCSFANMEEFYQAKKDYERVLEVDRGYRDVLFLYGFLHQKMEQFEEASEIYSEILDLVLNQPYFSTTSSSKNQNNKWGIDKIDTSLLVVYLNRGYCYQKLLGGEKKYEELARQDFEKAVKIVPVTSTMYGTRGFVYFLMKKWEEAKNDFMGGLMCTDSYDYKNLESFLSPDQWDWDDSEEDRIFGYISWWILSVEEFCGIRKNITGVGNFNMEVMRRSLNLKEIAMSNREGSNKEFSSLLKGHLEGLDKKGWRFSDDDIEKLYLKVQKKLFEIKDSYGSSEDEDEDEEEEEEEEEGEGECEGEN